MAWWDNPFIGGIIDSPQRRDIGGFGPQPVRPFGPGFGGFDSPPRRPVDPRFGGMQPPRQRPIDPGFSGVRPPQHRIDPIGLRPSPRLPIGRIDTPRLFRRDPTSGIEPPTFMDFLRRNTGRGGNGMVG
jgi:hypothetical protein